MTFWSGDAFSQLGQEGRGGLTVTQMFQDLRKMTASQRSTTHDHVVEPLPNVPASVISLFPNHDMPNLFKLTRSAIAKICNQGDLRNGGNEHAAAATAAALMMPSCCRGA